LNNKVENSHLPFLLRERATVRFRQMKSLQKFASVHASVHNHFSQERHLVDRQTYKRRLRQLETSSNPTDSTPRPLRR
jgi:putative transposase